MCMRETPESGAELLERGVEVLAGDGFRFVDGGGGERIVGEAIDLSRQAVCGLEQCFDDGGLEQWQLAAGEAQAVEEVLGKLLAGESL